MWPVYNGALTFGMSDLDADTEKQTSTDFQIDSENPKSRRPQSKALDKLKIRSIKLKRRQM